MTVWLSGIFIFNPINTKYGIWLVSAIFAVLKIIEILADVSFLKLVLVFLCIENACKAIHVVSNKLIKKRGGMFIFKYLFVFIVRNF